MERKIKIGKHTISQKSRPFLIAEAGVNYYDIAHKLSLDPIDAAKMMIEEAKKAGADAIKFQTYKAEKLASKNSPAYWDTKKEKTKSQYELFKKYDRFGEEEYSELSNFSKKIGIIFLSTPFDMESADYLDNLVPAFKIASSDITNKPFLEHIAEKGKPMLLSTGASTIKEIERALHWIKRIKNVDVAILHCVLCYPTEYRYANLGMIKSLMENFPKNIIGYSDHTLPSDDMRVLVTSYILGARVIEKHFTLDKSLPGNDHYHSMDPMDIMNFVTKINDIIEIIGDYEKDVIICEKDSRLYARRSIVAAEHIKTGDIITKNMITFKRPGTGISPADIDKVLGRKASKEINEDDIITWEMLE